MTGKLITFEGGEGCGKSTQVEEVSRFLARAGVPLLVTREPGGTAIGDEVRAILLNRCHRGMTALAELFLYLAARSQHVREVIRPALEAGKVVLCDRFHDSTVAYQGYGRGLDLDLVRELNARALDGIRPDLTFVLDLEVEEGLKRAKERSARRISDPDQDRFEEDAIEFHRRVRAGYRKLAEQESGRIVLIPAAGTRAEVSSRLRQSLERFLREHRVR